MRILLLVFALFIAQGLTSNAWAQPAPILTDVQIVKITSSKGGGETIRTNDSATLRDHGGTSLEVQVNQIGYRGVYYKSCSFAGSAMTYVNSTPIIANRVYVGYMLTYRRTGTFTSGFVNCEFKSSTPNVTKSDRITVK